MVSTNVFRVSLSLSFALWVGAAGCQPTVIERPLVVEAKPAPSILDTLNALDGVRAFEMATTIENARVFSLTVEQREDHDDVDSAVFHQRMVLLHRDRNAPMILATTGYDLFGPPEFWADYRGELTRITHGNQLIVEHRFFGESIADVDDRDWNNLNVAQSATDSHVIRTTLGALYVGNWIGTGVSKGGMTAIFHHTHYPDDLDGIVPYVAPITFGQDDQRYVDWLAAIGPTDGACGQRVRDLGVALIARVDELAPEVKEISPGGQGLTDALVQAAVAQQAFSFKWSFWQSWGSELACELLPDAAGDVVDIAPWGVFSAEGALGLEENSLAPYGYQVANELGSQGFDYTELEPYYDAVDWSVLPTGGEAPWPAQPSFVAETMVDVDTVLRTEAENVLAIYGAWDPWTAGRIEVDERNNSHVLIAPAVGHAARIASLAPDDRAIALARVSEMAGVLVDTAELDSESPLFSLASVSDVLRLRPDRLTVNAERVDQAQMQRRIRNHLSGVE